MTTVHSITGKLIARYLVACYLSYHACYVLSQGLCFCFANQPPRRLLMGHQPKTGEVEELLHLTSFLAALELPRWIFYMMCCILLLSTIFIVYCQYFFGFTDSYFFCARLLEKSSLLWMENWLVWHSVFPLWMSLLLTSQWGWRRKPPTMKLKMLSSNGRILWFSSNDIVYYWVLCKFSQLVIQKCYSILGLVLLNLSYIMLSFSGRNQRASWREFLVTLKMMWSPPTLWAIAGINYVNIIVAFFQLITWHYSFFCFPKGLLTIFLIIVPDQVFLMQRLELHWIRTLWSLSLGMTTSGDTGNPPLTFSCMW